jgi:hypothetical protein
VKWLAALVVFAGAGCVGNLTPEWQLDHDHIVAVRATPPGLLAGSAAVVDALVAHAGGPVSDDAPIAAMVGSDAPAALAAAPGLVAQGEGGSWIVTAPDDATLAEAAAELGLPAGSPVPLDIFTIFAATTPLAAIKTVTLGSAADNPTLGAVTIGSDTPGSDDSLVVPGNVQIALAIDEPAVDQVDWLTSCGTLIDDSEALAFLDVGPTDPQAGQFVVVVRTPELGVAWQVWPIAAAASGSGSE